MPRSIQTAVESLPFEAQKDFNRDYRKRAKSIMVAYIAWFLLGWHYLYLGRVGMQFAFWFTLGFLIVGWFVDFFRIPGMVNRKNEDLSRELMSQYKSIYQPAPVFYAAPVATEAAIAPDAPLTLRFFCYVGEQVVGPYKASDLKAMRSEGQIDDSTMICEEGETAWASLDSIKL